MDWLNGLIDKLSGVGNMLLLAVVVCGLGRLLKLTFAKALKSGLLISVGFLGISVLAGFLCDQMAPVIAAFSQKGGYTVVDVGWQVLAASAWMMPFSLIVVAGGFLLNVWWIRKGWIRTLNTDIWDYCHILFCSAIAYVVFHSVLAAVAVGIFAAFVAVKAGDLLVNRWQEHLECEGTTGSVVFHAATMFPVYYLCDRLIEHIPGLRNIDWQADRLVGRISIFADPAFIGFLSGAGLGLAAGLSVSDSLMLAFSMALFLVLAGRILALITEGIAPLSAAAKQWALKRIGDKPDLLIGMDFSLGQGDPTAINTSVLLLPIILILVLVLPGISFFPISLLPNLIVYTCVGSLACKGNTFRVMVGTVVLYTLMLYAQTWMAPLTTEMIAVAGVNVNGTITGGSSANIIAVLVAAVGKLLKTW